MKPLAIDLYCGLGGWAEGLLAEGFDVIGFDIERHEYGQHRYPAQLVIQDVRTLHGSQFKDAALIVASPPCQFFSFTAMPWSRAKQLAAEVRADPARLAKEIALFEVCFRIQREACEAAGHRIPLIVENVRGAQKWAGRARWNFGSYYLWGDVPALMPIVGAFKSRGLDWNDRSKPCDFTRHAGEQAIKGNGGSWFGEYRQGQPLRGTSPGSRRRKAASAMIAKIPLSLARHIGAIFRPEGIGG